MVEKDEIEFLRSRVADLETVLRQGHGRDLALAFQLPPVMEKLLGLLLSTERVTSEMIEQRLEISSQSKVAVFRLRNILKKWGVDIQSKRHIGYWLEPADKEKLLSLADTRLGPRYSKTAEPREPQDPLAA